MHLLRLRTDRFGLGVELFPIVGDGGKGIRQMGLHPGPAVGAGRQPAALLQPVAVAGQLQGGHQGPAMDAQQQPILGQGQRVVFEAVPDVRGHRPAMRIDQLEDLGVALDDAELLGREVVAQVPEEHRLLVVEEGGGFLAKGFPAGQNSGRGTLVRKPESWYNPETQVDGVIDEARGGNVVFQKNRVETGVVERLEWCSRMPDGSQKELLAVDDQPLGLELDLALLLVAAGRDRRRPASGGDRRGCLSDRLCRPDVFERSHLQVVDPRPGSGRDRLRRR